MVFYFENTFNNNSMHFMHLAPCPPPLQRSTGGVHLLRNVSSPTNTNAPTPVVRLHRYYSDRGTCAKCYLSCHTCSGPRRDQCVKCPKDWQLADGECHPECPEGFFKSAFGCQKCHHICKTCSGKCSGRQWLSTDRPGRENVAMNCMCTETTTTTAARGNGFDDADEDKDVGGEVDGKNDDRTVGR